MAAGTLSEKARLSPRPSSPVSLAAKGSFVETVQEPVRDQALLHRPLRLSRITIWLWPPLAFLLLALVMTWPLAAHLGSRLPGLGDALQQTWILAYNAHALRTDPANFWNAPIFYPYPDTAAYHDHHLVQSLVAAPLIWATGNPVFAHNLLILLSFTLTGWAVYLLAHAVAAESAPTAPAEAVAWAAFAAGCGVAFASYRIAHLVHLNLLQTGWLVLALFFLRRLLRPHAVGGGRWSDAVLLGLFVALQMANAFYYGYFAAVVLGAYGLFWAAGVLWQRVRRGEPLPWFVLARLGLAALIAAVFSVPLLLPYLRIYRTLGIVRSVAELENWSAPLRAYFSVTASNRLYAPLGEAVVDAGEMVLFPGLLLLLLGLLGAIRGMLRRRSHTSATDGKAWLFWCLLAAGALLLSLGTAVRLVRFGDPLPLPTLYTLLYTYVPGFGSMRVPSRWGWLVTLALAILAATALVHLLARFRSLWRHIAGFVLVAIILGEQLAVPVPLSQPVLADVPPVYPWLAAPAQADLTTVVELPVGPLPRGEELERIIWRHFHSMHHWKRQPIAYGALIPFGTVELMRRLQALPEPGVITYLQAVGVDTLILHRDEFEPGRLDALVAGLDALPNVSRRAEVGRSLVYAISPEPAFALPAGSIFVSNDERMPGLPVLGLIRRWQAEERALYGSGRLRFYGPLRPAAPGFVADYGLLAADEDPAAYGYGAAAPLWAGEGLALYRRAPALVASLSLATQPPGQFHPDFPAAARILLEDTRLHVNDARLSWPVGMPSGVVELDVASLGERVRVNGEDVAVPPGRSVLRLPLENNTVLHVEGASEQFATLRIRVVQGTGATPTTTPQPGLVARAEAGYNGGLLEIRVVAAGAAGVLLDIRGARALDDRPVHLLLGELPVEPAGGEALFAVDPLQPEAPWLLGRESPEDGRYIAYIKSAEAPDGPGHPVAKFNIRGGQLVDFEVVKLPLTVVP